MFETRIGILITIWISLFRTLLQDDDIEMNAIPPTTKPLRLACLHGWGQDGNIFKGKLGGFRKLFKNSLEFSFLDAPHLISSGNDDENGRAWFFKTSDGNWDNEGLQESLKYFASYYAQHGPFDGLLGFSQGAHLAAILCALPDYISDLQFVILIAGSKSSNPEHAVYYEKKIRIPSLHVMGETDTTITKSESEKLRDCFSANTTETLLHEGGHYVPVNKLVKDTYIMFLRKYSHSKSDP